jgi:hypothetical protein
MLYYSSWRGEPCGTEGILFDVRHPFFGIIFKARRLMDGQLIATMLQICPSYIADTMVAARR